MSSDGEDSGPLSPITNPLKRSISDVSNTVNRNLSDAGNSTNKMLSQAGDEFIKAQKLLQNPIEGFNFLKDGFDRANKNFGSDLRELAYAAGKGDLNSIGNTLINAGSHAVTLGQWDPGLETGSERAAGEAARAKELADEDAAIQMSVAENADRTRRRTNILEGSAKQRLKAPGMSLLTLKRK